MNQQQNRNLPVRQDDRRANALSRIKALGNSDAMKAKFKAILGEQAPAFMASVLNATRTNPSLLDCDQDSLWASAMVAAVLRLPIDSNLGFAALVPYKEKGFPVVQFQIMYKGFIQLAIRSGQYAEMDVVEIYRDELKSYNPISKELVFTPQETWKMREGENQNDIFAYYASFRLVSGFTKWVFMTKQAIDKHAKRYSQTYQQGKGNWVRNFHAMALKTPLKLLLSHWGILSIEMQMALKSDQASFIDIDKIDEPLYPDNENENEELPPPEEGQAPQIQAPADQPKADPIPEVFK